MLMAIEYETIYGVKKVFVYDEEVYKTQKEIRVAMELSDMHGEIKSGFTVLKETYELIKDYISSEKSKLISEVEYYKDQTNLLKKGVKAGLMGFVEGRVAIDSSGNPIRYAIDSSDKVVNVTDYLAEILREFGLKENAFNGGIKN